MNNNPDQERLLHDILEDSLPPGLHDSMLGQTLAAVRRRRRIQIASRAAGTAAFIFVGLTFWLMSKPTPAPSAGSTLAMVTSQPLNPRQVIGTDAGSVSVIASVPEGFGWITNSSGQEPVKNLDDQELLTLLAGKAAALVRQPSGQTELVFANPSDANGFPVK